jgi:hypothetical protein
VRSNSSTAKLLPSRTTSARRVALTTSSSSTKLGPSRGSSGSSTAPVIALAPGASTCTGTSSGWANSWTTLPPRKRASIPRRSVQRIGSWTK